MSDFIKDFRDSANELRHLNGIVLGLIWNPLRHLLLPMMQNTNTTVSARI